MQWSNVKRNIGATAMACALAAGCFGVAGTASLVNAPEASASTVSSKAMKAYKGKVKELKKDCRAGMKVSVGYADLDGNGVKELICTYKPKDVQGSGERQAIYTYKGGKVKRIFKCDTGVLGDFTYSQKSDSISYNRTGHGGELIQYYKLKDGKYKEVASKVRQSVKGGAVKTGKWKYSVVKDSKSKTVKKATFTKKISSLQKGKLHKVVLK